MNDSTQKTWFQSIKDALYAAYQGIITQLKDPFSGLTKQLQQKQNPDLIKLNAMRQKHFDLIAQEQQKTTTNYNAITKNITEDMKKYICDMIDEEIKKLGIPPCEFNIFTLGSMARGESGPITDLEIGFILKEKTIESYQYFYQLSQTLSDRIFLLGEHPDIGGKGLRMDEADNAPKHKKFFARNINREQEKKLLQEAILKKEWDKIPYEGSRPFIGTIDEIASYSKPGDFKQDKTQLSKMKKAAFDKEWDKACQDPKNKNKLKTKKGKAEIVNEINYWLSEMYQPFNAKELAIADDAGKNLGRNFAHLYGSTAVYQEFLTKKNRYLDTKISGVTNRKFMAKNLMVADIQNILEKGTSIYVTGELGKTLDIKRELYRFTEQFITNLGFYHACTTQNPIDILKELTKQNKIDQTTANEIIDFIEFTAALKLKEQSILKRQGFAAYFDEQEFADDKEVLEEKIDNLKQSIAFLETSDKKNPLLAVKKRALVESTEKYEHLLEMGPSHIYSEQDVNNLKEKYAPLAKKIFSLAQKWTANPDENLAFTASSAGVAPSVPSPLNNKLNNLLQDNHATVSNKSNNVRKKNIRKKKVAKQSKVSPPKKPVVQFTASPVSTVTTAPAVQKDASSTHGIYQNTKLIDAVRNFAPRG